MIVATRQSDQPPLEAPRGTDPQWQSKIRAAKEARSGAQQARQGKPGSFRRAVGRKA